MPGGATTKNAVCQPQWAATYPPMAYPIALPTGIAAYKYDTTRPRIERGKQSAIRVGAAGPYPPSPTPTKRRIANKNANVVARPVAAVAALQRMTPRPISTQRENRSASQPKISELIM